MFSFLSSYAHPFEKKAENFFKWVTSYREAREVRSRLLALMQENLLVLNMWLEKRFKNYKVLSKRHRKELYRNAERIEQDFFAHLRRQPKRAEDSTEVHFLRALMAYFDPKGRFHYQKESAFGKLFADPHTQKLVGDCNQIVTLYAHLWSRKFPIEMLQAKFLPGHVCLHYKGIDIECTSGRFREYKEFDYIGDISELISTNLLDVHDPREAAASIKPEDFVKGAQLSLLLSSKRALVEKNIDVAYRNLGVQALQSKNFETAIFYFRKLKDGEPLRTAYHSAAAVFANKGDFRKAHYYANLKGDSELKKTIYGMEYNAHAVKVKSVKTKADVQKHRNTFRRMLELAHKMGDEARAERIRKMLG